jgi:hypothetical protein
VEAWNEAQRTLILSRVSQIDNALELWRHRGRAKLDRLAPPPLGPSRGSGKFGTPFARMHFDIEIGTFGAPYG